MLLVIFEHLFHLIFPLNSPKSSLLIRQTPSWPLWHVITGNSNHACAKQVFCRRLPLLPLHRRFSSTGMAPIWCLHYSVCYLKSSQLSHHTSKPLSVLYFFLFLSVAKAILLTLCKIFFIAFFPFLLTFYVFIYVSFSLKRNVLKCFLLNIFFCVYEFVNSFFMYFDL